MQDKIIYQMLESFRGTLSQGESFEVALLIMAWAKLSATQKIPEDMRLTSALLSEPARALKVLVHFGHGEAKNAQIVGDAKGLARLDPVALVPALDLAFRLSGAGLIQSLDPTDISCADPVALAFGRALPPEVATLLVNIANVLPGESVYVPWDESGQLAARAARQGGIV